MSSSKKKMVIKNIFTSHGGCGCGGPKAKKEVFEPKPKAEISAAAAAAATAATAVASASFSHHDPKPSSSLCRSSSSSWERGASLRNSIDDDDDPTSTTYSTNCSETEHGGCSKSKIVDDARREFPKFGDSAVAVVKDSDDPYQDFRQSMIQMILEREIYSKDDLRELLSCFLDLNSSSHHKVIVQAFMDIWDKVLSKNPKHLHHHDPIPIEG